MYVAKWLNRTTNKVPWHLALDTLACLASQDRVSTHLGRALIKFSPYIVIVVRQGFTDTILTEMRNSGRNGNSGLNHDQTTPIYI